MNTTWGGFNDNSETKLFQYLSERTDQKQQQQKPQTTEGYIINYQRANANNKGLKVEISFEIFYQSY